MLHITSRQDWEQALASGEYRAASLADEGFIHCSTAAQVVDTAERYYRGVSGLVLLRVEPSLLKAALRWEAPKRDASSLFPHIYGPLNLDAVVAVLEFPCEADGSFVLPAALL